MMIEHKFYENADYIIAPCNSGKALWSFRAKRPAPRTIGTECKGDRPVRQGFALSASEDYIATIAKPIPGWKVDVKY